MLSIRTNLKKFGVAAVFLAFGVLGVNSYAQPISVTENVTAKPANFYEITKAKDEYWNKIPVEERKGWKQYARWRYFWESRVSPNGEFPSQDQLIQEIAKYNQNQKKENYSPLASAWTLVGPTGRPESASGERDQGVGRANIVRFHPNDPNELWIGAATGGVWRSKDGGKTWKDFPFTQFLSLGVSDIEISQSNPNIVYVATGDMDAASTNADYYSIGVIKTTDGGSTWNLTKPIVGSNTISLSDGILVGKMLIDPTDPNIVTAATKGGIYKTINGGETWVQKQKDAAFIDLEYHPTNSQIMYASTYSMGGTSKIYKSTNAGDTWTLKKSISGAIRIAIETTPANPEAMYALVASSQLGLHSVLYSDDEGETYTPIAEVANTPNLLGWYNGLKTDYSQNDPNYGDSRKGQGQYDLCLAVSPKNEYLVYVGGVNIWKTDNLGTWAKVTHWNNSPTWPLVHADQHDLKFSPDGSKLYSCNDGGIDVTTDGGSSWISLIQGLSITQFYKIGVSQAKPSVTIGGSQDNGTSMFRDGKWYHSLGGDGMDCAIDPKNSQNVYGSLYYGSFSKSSDGGISFNSMLSQYITGEEGDWVTPFAIDPTNPSNLYAGYNTVWKSTSYGSAGSWKKTEASLFTTGYKLKSLVVAPNNSNYVYAATPYHLYLTSDAGAKWTKLSTTSFSGAAISNLAVHPTDATKLYITKSGFSENDKVYLFDGTKAVNLSGNLPNVPVNCVVYQKNSPDRIYIGTDIGVFYSDYGSNYWKAYQNGLPNVIVNDLEILESTKRLRAGTYGRGVWETDLVNCNIAKPEITVTGNLSFCPGESVNLKSKNTYKQYSWTGTVDGKDTTFNTSEITISTNAKLTLIGSDGGECDAKSELITVTRYNPAKANIVPSTSPSICEGDTLVLTFSNFLAYKNNFTWNTGETTNKLYVTKPGIYCVVATTADGCKVPTDTIKVTLNPKPLKPAIASINSDEFLEVSKNNKMRWYYSSAKTGGSFKLTGDTTQRVKTKIGRFYAEVAISGDCWVSTDTVSITVGVHDVITGKESIEVLPNPSKGLFNINLNFVEGINANITIVNLTGEKIYESDVTTNSNGYSLKLDLTDKAPGVYFMYIKTPDGTYSSKLVKE